MTVLGLSTDRERRIVSLALNLLAGFVEAGVFEMEAGDAEELRRLALVVSPEAVEVS